MNIELDLTEEQEAAVKPLLEECKRIFQESGMGSRAMVVAQIMAADNYPGSTRERAWMRVGFIDPDKAERLIRSAGLDAEQLRKACATG